MKNGGDDHPKRKKPRSASLEHQLTRALARALVAEADAVEARANEKAMLKQVAFWKAEALQERRRAARADAEAEIRKPLRQDCEIHDLTRARLIKALRMLGSDQDGQRAAAALVAEKQRLTLGKTWNELIVGEHKDHGDLDKNDQAIDPVDDYPKKQRSYDYVDDDDDGDYRGPIDDYEGPL